MMTSRDGRVIKMENVFLRGSLVKFIVLPDLLKSAPVFKKIQVLHKSLDKGKSPSAGNPGDRKTARSQKK